MQNRKKVDILAELKRRDYVPFTKGQSGAGNGSPVTPTDAGEEAENDDDGVEIGSTKETATRGYDYLLSMPIWNLTLEYVGYHDDI